MTDAAEKEDHGVLIESQLSKRRSSSINFCFQNMKLFICSVGHFRANANRAIYNTRISELYMDGPPFKHASVNKLSTAFPRTTRFVKNENGATQTSCMRLLSQLMLHPYRHQKAFKRQISKGNWQRAPLPVLDVRPFRSSLKLFMWHFRTALRCQNYHR